MKSKQILISLFVIGFFIYTVWSFIDWVKERKNKTWSDSQIETMIDQCISSSKYISSLDSVIAHDICGCAVDKIINDYSYDEIWELNKKEQDSLMDLFKPIMRYCMFPQLFEDKYTVINDSTQLLWINDKICSFWSPTSNDYRIAESILESAIIANTNENWLRLDTESISNYYRQYSFFTNPAGDSIIYINAFCDVIQFPVDSSGIWKQKEHDWKNNTLIVNDGGDCYWTIKINLTKKTYYDFNVNGEA